MAKQQHGGHSQGHGHRNDLHEVHEKLDMIMASQTKVLAALKVSAKKETHMANELAELQAAVEENTTVDQSIMTLVDGLAAKIEELKNDPVKLAAYAKALRDSSALTAAKVLANTPQGPEPTA